MKHEPAPISVEELPPVVPMPEDFDPNHLEWTWPIYYSLAILVVSLIAGVAYLFARF